MAQLATCSCCTTVITGNSSDWGGGVAVGAAESARIDSNFISDNTARPGGGIVIFNAQRNVVITNNVIVGNNGGQIHEYVGCCDGGASLHNNTVVGGSGIFGTALYITGYDDQTRIANNIFKSSTAATAVHCDGLYQSNPPLLANNDVLVAGGGNAYSGTCSGLANANGNFSADPLFADEAARDFRLRFGSPAIDAGTNTGTPTTDYAGVPRPIDGNFDASVVTDIGAYELDAPEIVTES